jgi:hypothetical protein
MGVEPIPDMSHQMHLSYSTMLIMNVVLRYYPLSQTVMEPCIRRVTAKTQTSLSSSIFIWLGNMSGFSMMKQKPDSSCIIKLILHYIQRSRLAY